MVKQSIRWSEVKDAVNYTVKFGGKEYEVEGTEFDLSEIILIDGSDYLIKVRANASDFAKNSVWSDEFDARYMQLAVSLKYERNTVSWKPVIGATFYEVKVNDASPVRVENAYAAIALNKVGENIIKVRFFDGARWSAYVETTVNAYAVMFNSNGGSAVATKYVALGDELVTEEPVKEGCDFAGWYNTVGGAADNGAVYDDIVYSQSRSIVLYADWTPKTYTIKVVKGEGEESEVKVVYTKEFYIEPCEESADALFAGYYTAPDGMGTQLTDELGNSLLPWKFTDVEVIYAYFSSDLLRFTLREDDTYSVVRGNDLSKFKKVTVPVKFNGKAVTVIAANAFRYSSKLEEINIPNTIEVIETNTAFSGCSGLQRINIYDAGKVDPRYFSEDGVLFARDVAGTEISLYPQGKTGEFEIPDGIVRIPQKAFINISKLTNIVIPASVRYIGTQAFYGCTALENIAFLEAKQGDEAELTIDSYAFQKCKALTEINFPAHLKSVSFDAFNACTSLTDINVTKGCADYGSVNGMLTDGSGKTIVYCPTAKKGVVRVPASIENIQSEAFLYCDKINEVIFSSAIVSIGEKAFYGCASLRRVSFEGSDSANETTIGKAAFSRCYALTSVVFEDNSNVAYIMQEAFAHDFALTSFTFGAATKEVGASAFEGCYYLASIAFAEGMTEVAIDKTAFTGCNSLIVVKIPSTMTSIPVDAVNESASIQTIEVDRANPYFAADGTTVYSADKKILYFYSKNNVSAGGVATIDAAVEEISNGVFKNNRNVVSIALGANLKRIGASAFANMPYLTTVTFDGNITDLAIEESAFEGTVTLGAIAIPSGATSIGTKAFYGSGVTNVNLGKGVTEIGDSAFANTAKLTEFTIEADSRLLTIGNEAFASSTIKEITISQSVSSIGAGAFKNTASLSSVSIADGSVLKSIGDEAFASSALTSLSLPSTIETLGVKIFSNCKSLLTVSFAAGMTVTAIPDGTFIGCDALVSYNVPSFITAIGAEAFKNCKNLSTITFEAGEADLIIGKQAFYGCSAISALNLPSRLVSIGDEAMIGSSISSITFTDKDAGGVNESSRLVEIGRRAFASAKIENIVLPEGLKHIGASAFEYSSLKNVVIPSSVNDEGNRLGMEADEDNRDGKPVYVSATFYGCASLETVEFKEASDPASSLSLNSDMFYGCASLKKVILPKRLTSSMLIEAIGTTTFVGCDSLSEIVIAADCETFVVEDGILYELNEAGEKVVLKLCVPAREGKVVVPGTVKSIAGGAFMNCKLVTEVEFLPSEDETSTLVIENGSADMSDNKFYYSAFYGTEITGIVLPSRLSRIGDYAFYQTKITSLEIPVNVRDDKDGNEAIGDYAFYQCGSLASVRFVGNEGETGDSRYSIGYAAFRKCKALASIEFGYGLKNIEQFGFAECDNTGLTSLSFPSTTKALGIRAFAMCKSVTSITFAEGTYIDNGSLTNCGLGNSCFDGTKLTSFVFPAAASYGRSGSNTLFGINNRTIKEVTLPKEYAKVESGTLTGLKALEKINVEEGNEKFVSEDGVLYAINAAGEKITLVYYPIAKKGSSFVVPSTVQSIGDKTSIGGTGASATLKAFSFNTKISKVTIPASVTTVQSLAFFGSGISEVEFLEPAEGESAKPLTFGSKAFGNCGSLSSIVFPSRTAAMGTSMFESSGIEEVDFGPSCRITEIADYAFSDTDLYSIRIPKSVTRIGEEAFYACMSLEVFEIEDGCVIEEIGSGAFNGCMFVQFDINDLLANVTEMGEDVFWMNQRLTCGTDGTLRLPDHIEEIPQYSFDGLSVIKNVIWPSNLKTVGEGAFRGTGITELILPETVTSVDWAAFENCKSLKKVVIPSNCYFDWNVFSGCVELEEVDITTSVIGRGMFRNCKKLEKFTIKEGTTAIRFEAFSGCTSLKEIVIPTSVTNDASFSYSWRADGTSAYGLLGTGIEKNAFKGCTSLTSVTFADGGIGNLTIGDSAFEGCSSLESLTLPDRLVNVNYVRTTIQKEFPAIGESAFKDCIKLSEYGDLAVLEGIGNYAFMNTAITEVKIPATLRYFGVAPFLGCNISYIEVEEGNFTVLAKDGVLYDRAMSKLILYPTVASLDVVVPVTVDTIEPSAFAGSNVKSIVMPSVSAIADGTFKGCTKLESITLGDRLTAIGANAFEGCTAVDEISIPTSVTSVGASAFAGWTAEQTVRVPGYTAVPESWNAKWYDGSSATVVWKHSN